MTAAAAPISWADADVPPSLTTVTASAAPCVCSNAATLSPGADTLTRAPNPDAKSADPSQRTSGKACCAVAAAPVRSCGGAAKMSSEVTPPASIDPESKSLDAAPDNATSPRLVGVPPGGVTSVGAALPAGLTAALVNVRSPSPDDSDTLMRY